MTVPTNLFKEAQEGVTQKSIKKPGESRCIKRRGHVILKEEKTIQVKTGTGKGGENEFQSIR